jgi:hypothetical protein
MLLLFSISSAIEVGGHITEDTTWSPANNPYLVTTNIFIDSDVTLHIQPGVEIRLASCYLDNESYINGEFFMLEGEESGAKMFWVDGRIIAHGTAENPIVFTRDSSSDFYHWGTIYFNNPDHKSDFSYCRFEYSSIICFDAAYETKGAISGGVSELSVINCDFVDNYGGLDLEISNNLEVINNNFDMIEGMNPNWVDGTFNFVDITADETDPGNVIFCGNSLPDSNEMEIHDCNILMNSNNISNVFFTSDYNTSAYISENHFSALYNNSDTSDNRIYWIEELYFDNNSHTPDTLSTFFINFKDGIISNNNLANISLRMNNCSTTAKRDVVNNLMSGYRLNLEDDFNFYNNIIDFPDLDIYLARDSYYYNCLILPGYMSVGYSNYSVFQNCIILGSIPFGYLQFKNCITNSGVPEDNSLGDNLVMNETDYALNFYNYADKDYHLRPGSIAIDAGDNTDITYPFDLDGNNRIYDGDYDSSSIIDIGPYEYASNESGGVQIIVYDHATGNPIQFALAKFDGNSGNFDFSDLSGIIQYDLPAGIHDLTIEKMFYEDTAEIQIEIIDDELTQIMVPMYSALTHSEPEIIPEITEIKLSNHPNPFNPITTISFELKTENTESTEIEIYNIKGQKIKLMSCHPEPVEGQHIRSVTWDGTDSNNNPVSSGIYFAVLKQNDKVLGSRKMMLLK